jgi:hypothetical protein
MSTIAPIQENPAMGNERLLLSITPLKSIKVIRYGYVSVI